MSTNPPEKLDTAPNASPLPAEEWLKDLFHETTAEQMSNQQYSHRSVIKLMESYSTHVNAGLLDKLALLEANPERGKCSICHATIWRNDAYMEEMGKSFHPICKVIERAEAAESRISVLERERDEARTEAERYKMKAGFPLVCNACGKRTPISFNQCQPCREKRDAAESQLSTLREALRKLIYSAKEACVYMGEVSPTLSLYENIVEAERALTPPTEPPHE